jgi:hypothetical protein
VAFCALHLEPVRRQIQLSIRIGKQPVWQYKGKAAFVISGMRPDDPVMGSDNAFAYRKSTATR